MKFKLKIANMCFSTLFLVLEDLEVWREEKQLKRGDPVILTVFFS